jgi:hypothetical protein
MFFGGNSMEFGAVFEMITSTVAAIGIICFVHYISDVFFLPKEIALTIKILDDDSRQNADILLRVLERSSLKRLGGGICVVVAEKYSNDDELSKLIEDMGGKRYVVYK